MLLNRVSIAALVAICTLAILVACATNDGPAPTSTTPQTSTSPQQPAAPVAAEAPTGDQGVLTAPIEAAPAARPVAVTGSAPVMVEPQVTRVVLGSTAAAQESNIAHDVGSPDSWQKRPMYEWLIGMDAQTGQPIPMLATGWSIEGDGDVFRFTLREGVRFHSGGEFTAADVVHAADVRFADPTDTLFHDTIKSVEVVNDHEVVFTYQRLEANWVYTVSQQSGFEQESKASYDTRGGYPTTLSDPPIAGTGPYQFMERVQGSKIVYERVPYQHWRATPDFQELSFRFHAEASTRLAALLTGEIHITTINADSYDLAAREGMRLIQGKVPGQRTFFRFSGVNLDLENVGNYLYPGSPIVNVNVRKALNKAIDRGAINEAFFGGRGQTMVLNHFHPTREAWDPGWDQRFEGEYGYDPDAARKLLAEAGYGPNNPMELNILLVAINTYSGAEDVAEAAEGMFREVGIKSTLVTMDVATRRANDRALEFDNHIQITGTSSDQFTGWRVYNSSFPPRYGLEDAFTNELFSRIRSEIDAEKRAPLWRELGEYSFVNHTSIPLFWLPAEVVINPEIVAEWTFPGSITGFWTHVENIRASG